MTNKHQQLTEGELEAVSAAGYSGIDALIMVCQLKANDANNQAMHHGTVSHGGVVQAGWDIKTNVKV